MADQTRAESSNLTASEIAVIKTKRERDNAHFVDPELWDGFQLYLMMQTQWVIVAGLGVARTGLRYESIPLCFKMLKIVNETEAFEVLQFLERELIKGQNGR